MVGSRTEFLEVTRLADSGEYIVGLLSIQCVGLQPFFASGNPVSPRRSNDAPPSRHEAIDYRLARQWGQSCAVRFVLRTGDDHARNALRLLRNRTGIETREGIYRPVKAVRQRLIEH